MTARRLDPSSCVLFHGPEHPHAALISAIDRTGVVRKPIDELRRDPAACTEPAVVLADVAYAADPVDPAALPDQVVVVAADRDVENALGEAADLSLAGVADVRPTMVVLRTAFLLSAERRSCMRARADLADTSARLKELNRIGMLLMKEVDRRALVRQILDQALTFTLSDFGALFLTKAREDGTPRLLFVGNISRSVEPPDYSGLAVDIDSSSTVGHAALTRRTLVLDDIHGLPPDAPFRAHAIATDQPGYWIRSVMAIPLFGQEGNVLGTMLLGNRKRDAAARITGKEDAERWTIPYSEEDIELGESLVGQAAVAIENILLLEEIERIFESFVKASVIAIDQRDPTTAGHSIRVAMLTDDLAAALDRDGSGVYRDVHFTETEAKELHYAALLHDFGKIGVREDVLTKSKKLPPLLGERVEARFDLIRCTIALQHERRRARLLRDGGDPEVLAGLDARLADDLARIDRYRAIIRIANEPALLPEDAADMLLDVAQQSFTGPDGRSLPYLMPDELHYLRVPYGSLDEYERREIQMHAALTLQYLSYIPWRDDYRNIPRYAAAHHEKLNGSGYPERLAAADIPVQVRIITIADVFDALTASDRPYKSAVSADRALDIITADAAGGMLDSDLVRILIDGQVYRRVLEEDWRRYA